MKKLLCTLAAVVCLPVLMHAALPTSSLSKARLGTACYRQPNSDIALECWLNANPNVAAAMQYQDATLVAWPAWPDNAKQDLFSDFDAMVTWYDAGMPASSAPHFFPNTNLALGPPDPVYGLYMTPNEGTEVYVSEVAASLAAELTAQFSWSIATYTPTQLAILLDMNQRYTFLSPPTVAVTGYYWQGGMIAAPADPSYVAYFFKSNNLVASTASETIALLFKWERQLRHSFYILVGPNPVVPTEAQIEEYLWGPNVPPIPDFELIAGSTYTGPDGPQFGRFTDGCAGTMEFMQSVLRTVNIPEVNTWLSCGHATPLFPTAGVAMTHGDDPYDDLSYVTPYPGFPVPAPSEYLVSTTEYSQLFPAGQSSAACLSAVGVQAANIGIQYASDTLMNIYCEDLASGASPANGQVYQLMSYYYSLQTLENMGLWTNLANKESALNWCATMQ